MRMKERKCKDCGATVMVPDIKLPKGAKIRCGVCFKAEMLADIKKKHSKVPVPVLTSARKPGLKR